MPWPSPVASACRRRSSRRPRGCSTRTSCGWTVCSRTSAGGGTRPMPFCERARAEEEQARALRDTAERELRQAEHARREARTEALAEAESESRGSSRDAEATAARSRVAADHARAPGRATTRSRPGHGPGPHVPPRKTEIASGDAGNKTDLGGGPGAGHPARSGGRGHRRRRRDGRCDAWRAQDPAAGRRARTARPGAR